jgi:hypothetical protein
MMASLHRADVAYEVVFKRPLLDRPAGVTAPLQSLYDALSENFTISISDVVVNQSATPSQTSATYTLFGGAGAIELRPDRWRGVFRNIASEPDIELIVRCLSVVGSALEKTSERTSPARAVVTAATWYKSDVILEQISALLKNFWVQPDLKAGFLNAEKVDVDLNARLENSKEGWDGTFYVAPSKVADAELFINYIGTYISGGKYNSIAHQAEHCRSMLRGMLAMLGFSTNQAN